MKTELDMVRATSWGAPALTDEMARTSARKRLNGAANTLVHDAVLKNDLPALTEKLADMMIVTARILVEQELEPDLENFVYACAELIGGTRKAMDDALRFDNLDDFKLASVMMEVVLKGMAATLGLSLEELMKAELAKERI
jgi:hypothetical protein